MEYVIVNYGKEHTMTLEECKTAEQIARWLLENSDYYFDKALEEAEQILEERNTQ